MLSHKPAKPSSTRMKVLHEGRKYFKTDGLSNLNFEVVEKVFYDMYTFLSVDLSKSIVLKNNESITDYVKRFKTTFRTAA